MMFQKDKYGDIEDLTNRKFGKLTVTELLDKWNCGSARWWCHCDCGKNKVVSSFGLLHRNIDSCGCKLFSKKKEYFRLAEAAKAKNIEICKVITERQDYILKQRYIFDRTLRSVGGDLGVTLERVRQIESNAFTKLRRAIDDDM